MNFRQSVLALLALTAAAVPVATGCNSILDNQPAVIGDIGDGNGTPDASQDTSADASLSPVTPPAQENDATAPPQPRDANPPPADAAPSECEPGKKKCDGVCEPKSDPVFGCTESSCTPCSLPRATAVCAAAKCAVGTCNPGYADCDQNAANGCETDLSTTQHCGSCNAVCGAAAPYCAPSGPGFVCTTGCTASAPTLCGNQCVDLTSASTHCGSCNNACPTVANAQTSCAQSACKFTCDAGYHACGNTCASNASPASCGGSCTPCTAPANAIATCNGTACGFACMTGFHLCGNACVSNAAPATCGGACTPCATPTNGTATCNGTACGFSCGATFHACGNACASNTDPATCGGACAPCPSGANSTATCDGTACGLSCAANYADCDKNPANGCEVLLTSDPVNCGTCAKSCNGQTCTNGACSAPPMDAGPG